MTTAGCLWLVYVFQVDEWKDLPTSLLLSCAPSSLSVFLAHTFWSLLSYSSQPRTHICTVSTEGWIRASPIALRWWCSYNVQADSKGYIKWDERCPAITSALAGLPRLVKHVKEQLGATSLITFRHLVIKDWQRELMQWKTCLASWIYTVGSVVACHGLEADGKWDLVAGLRDREMKMCYEVTL